MALLLILFGAILGCLNNTFAKPTSSLFEQTCPNEWYIATSVPAEGTSSRIHCVGSETSVCELGSCNNFPVCQDCTSSKDQSYEVECRKKYRAADSNSSSTICIDSEDTIWNCAGPCQGVLTCGTCSHGNPSFNQQLSKRGNPFAASMGATGPNSNAAFDNDLAL